MVVPDLNSVEAYDYELPEKLIAQHPVTPRDSSRLMVVNRVTGTFEHATFLDLPKYLDARDLMVANNTRVLRARLLGSRVFDDGKLGGKVEFLMLEQKGERRWEGAFHASAKHKPGVRFRIPTPDGRGLNGVLVVGASASASGTVVAEFDRDPVESGAGEIPLPHYIERQPQETDEEQYQTVYAKEPGSAAAPTAGLHFTPRVLDRLREKGVRWEEVTLNVGLGTFRPVKAADIRDHVMHEEKYFVSEATARAITEAKRTGKERVLAVGTTAVRTLESAWIAGENRLAAGEGRTSIFIHPGSHEFRVVDRMLTNFHLPKSTLLMLLSAFAGRDLVLQAYREAVRLEYRFFSYGDSMLIL